MKSIFRLIQVALPGLLFFLIVFQYKQMERLKADNARLKGRLLEFEASKERTLAGPAAQASPTNPEAQRQAAKIQAREKARRSAQKNKRDLEKFLEISPDKPHVPARQQELKAGNCRALEVDSNKYAGQRISITDKVKKLDNFYSFVECSGIRITTDRLDKEDEARLQSKFAQRDSVPVSFSGEYSGLVFYPDKIK